MGDDDGCFASALASVRHFGGVIEHPADSHAWRWFGLCAPRRGGGWYMADWMGGWTCFVEQGHYGHRARKLTWLYVNGVAAEHLPSLRWGKSAAKIKIDEGYHTAEERRRAKRNGAVARLSHRERRITPEPFRDVLLEIARRAA